MNDAAEQECLYCGRLKPPSELSDEHIWPQALGGKLLDGHLRTLRVCRACNSKCGLFVDGAFVRSFLNKAATARSALQYARFDTGKSPILPFTYCGKASEIKAASFGDFATCEVWLSPCQARVLHLHNNDSPKFAVQAGGNPMAKKNKKTAGMAVFCPASQNQEWVKAGLSSFAEHFAKCTRYVCSISMSKEYQQAFGAPPPPVVEQALLEAEAGRQLEHIKTRPALSPEDEHRFLSKVALGLGHILFGDLYLQTQAAVDHRRTLNETKIGIRRSLPRMSISQLEVGGNDELKSLLGEIIAWSGGIVVAATSFSDGGTHLFTSVYGRPSYTRISDQHIKTSPRFPRGVVHVLVPQLREHVGPLEFSSFFNHQRGVEPVHELVRLASLRVDPLSLPPLE